MYEACDYLPSFRASQYLPIPVCTVSRNTHARRTCLYRVDKYLGSMWDSGMVGIEEATSYSSAVPIALFYAITAYL